MRTWVQGALLLLFATLAAAQSPEPAPAATLLILPFENTSKAPGLEWIREAFPAVLGQRLASERLFVVQREERLYAFDRFGIPASLVPSRATLYRVAEQMDTDYVLVGRYGFDGAAFTASAQLLDMNQRRLFPEVREAGPLVKIIDLQTSLAYQLLRLLGMQPDVTQEQFVGSFPPIRLDAFENYIRAVIATAPREKVRLLREAIRLNPQYTTAHLALGKTYFEQRQHEPAAATLTSVPKEDPEAGEAWFYAGLAYFYRGNYEGAEHAFRFVSSRLPLTEIFNNLGVVAARRGRGNPVEHFQRAMQADPAEPDYRFNLALALYRNGDTSGASRQLRELLARRPGDHEARALLERVQRGPVDAATRLPAERLKTNYDESSFRQLAMEIHGAIEAQLAGADPRSHARFHVERGRELLGRGLVGQAEREFREALALDASSAGAHAGMAHIHEANGNRDAARSAALAGLRLQASADAYLLLARLDMSDNNPDSASGYVERALAIEPGNAVGLALKRQIASRLMEKAPERQP